MFEEVLISLVGNNNPYYCLYLGPKIGKKHCYKNSIDKGNQMEGRERDALLIMMSKLLPQQYRYNSHSMPLSSLATLLYEMAQPFNQDKNYDNTLIDTNLVGNIISRGKNQMFNMQTKDIQLLF